jgi:hypothetical protein
MLHPRAIKVVYDFAQFPDNYRETDVLQSVPEFGQADIDRLDISSRWGLFAYLHARRKWSSAFGKIHEIGKVPDTDETD